MDADQAGPHAGAGGRQALAEACDGFGPDTPASIRRQAAALLRNQGWNAREIGDVFGVPGAEIARSLGGDSGGPRADRTLAIGAVRELAGQAARAAEELSRARSQLSPDRPGVAWRDEMARLTSFGYSAAELKALFGAVRGDALDRDLGAIPGPAGLPDLPGPASLAALVRDRGPAALDAYRPAIDQPASLYHAAAWFGISPLTILGYQSRRRPDGRPLWPAPDAGDQWTYRALVLHRAAGPGHGGGQISPENKDLADRILALLAAAPAPLSTTEIRDQLGVRSAYHEKVLRLLEKLAAHGIVQKTIPEGGPRRAYWQLQDDHGEGAENQAAGASQPGEHPASSRRQEPGLEAERTRGTADGTTDAECQRCAGLRAEIDALKAEIGTLRAKVAVLDEAHSKDVAGERGRRDRRNARLGGQAAKHAQRWTDAELSLLTQPDLTIGEVADELGRSYEAVRAKHVQMRRGAPSVRKLAASITAAGGGAEFLGNGGLKVTGPRGSITLTQPSGVKTRREHWESAARRNITVATGLTFPDDAG